MPRALGQRIDVWMLLDEKHAHNENDCKILEYREDGYTEVLL